jgi:hypothetical protein
MSKGNQIKSIKLYNKPPYVYGNNFYIHKHIENIGRMGGGTSLSDATMAIIFHKYKQSSAKAVKNQYVEYIKGSMKNVSVGKMSAIEEALNSENSSDKVLTRLHNILQQSFEAQFNNQKVIETMNKQAGLTWSTKYNSQMKELDKLLQSNGTQGNVNAGFKALDNILQVLEETCKQLRSKTGRGLAVILANQRRSNYSSTRELGQHLNEALDVFINQNNAKSISNIDIQEGLIAANLIKNLSETLEKNQTKTGAKKGTYLSSQSLQGLFQKNIFPSLLELFVNDVEFSAKNNIYTAIGAAVNETKISATDRSYLQAFDAEGNIIKGHYLENYGVNKGKETQDYGKADSLANITVNASKITGKTQGSIEMSVGISTKAYITNSIGVPLDQNYETFSLGRGLNLGQAFSLIPGLTTYNRYLGYNIISRDSKQFPNSLIALQDVLTTRGLAYLAAGRGPGDSAQLLFLNGNIMSMWDIIQYGMYNNIGKSGLLLGESMSKDNNNGIYIHINNRSEIIKLANDQNSSSKTRIIGTNNAINTAVMQLEIIPKKILDYAKTLKI